MIYGLYLSAAGALVEDARHAVIANNIANVNTTGFKSDLALVQARNAESIEDALSPYSTIADRAGGGVLLHETFTRHVQGPIQLTGNEFDLAINGKGFFAVTDGQDTSYTRAGAFTRDASGRLAMPDGLHFLSDSSGRPLTVPLEGDVNIAHDGTVSVNGASAGKIDLYSFSDPSLLEKTGSNLFVNTRAVRTTGGGSLKQRALETSAVSPANELSKMILAMRGYEANMQLIKMQDQTLADLVAIGRVNI